MVNIGIESKQAKIDKRGVAFLNEILGTSEFFEIHIKDEDKVPNSDGFFLITNPERDAPLRRFDCQIKTTDEIPTRLQNGQITLQCDTKFLNYANLRVTTDPCVLFFVALKEKKAYFKILTNDFLETNSRKINGQESMAVHFNPSSECIGDANEFYKRLLGVAHYKKEFDIKNISILEYQKGFDLVNDFFDKDFSSVKTNSFPYVWKFGIAYQKYDHANEKPKIGDTDGRADYDTCYGVYTINYGDKTLPFQQAEVNDKTTRLRFIGHTVHTYSLKTDVESAMSEWIEHFLVLLVSQYAFTIDFLPSDALFEILFCFADTFEEKPVSSMVTISDLEKLLLDKQELMDPDAREMVSNSIRVLKSRGLVSAQRVFEKYDSECSPLHPINMGIRVRNNQKLFSSIPHYYEEFIHRLFGEKYYELYVKRNDCKYMLAFETEGNVIKQTYYLEVSPSQKWTMEETQEISPNHPNVRSGILDTDFRNNDYYNIAFGLLSLLYSALCRRFGYSKSHIEINSLFSGL